MHTDATLTTILWGWPMPDLLTAALVVFGFAALVTAHLSIALALAPRRRALVALVAPPLAPYWAWREGMRGRAIAWIAGLVVYFSALVAAWRP